MNTGFKHLLLIDDDEDDREFFLQVIQEIFLDLNMPLMNGRQFLNEIKNYRHLTEIPVVILTTSFDAQTIQETIRMGAKHFITKPNLLHGWELALKGFFDNTEKYLKE